MTTENPHGDYPYGDEYALHCAWGDGHKSGTRDTEAKYARARACLTEIAKFVGPEDGEAAAHIAKQALATLETADD